MRAVINFDNKKHRDEFIAKLTFLNENQILKQDASITVDFPPAKLSDIQSLADSSRAIFLLDHRDIVF